MSTTVKGILGILGAGMAAAALIVWIVYGSGSGPTAETPPSFGVSDTRTGVSVIPDDTTGTLPVVSATDQSLPIFKITDGPVAGAAILRTTRPTTTVARFVMQTSGHVFDLVLDSPGAVPKAISNTTIPGVAEVVWTSSGLGGLLRYVDAGSVKTAHLSLSAPNSTSSAPVRVQFLPAGISSIAASPDGARVAYLLPTTAGADGYVANANGGQAQKLFSLPLSQAAISWPAPNTLLAVSAPASGVMGIAFSINAQNGAAAPLLTAEGLAAVANQLFTTVLYQTSGATHATYAYNIENGLSTSLAFDPLPEQCIWSAVATSTVYCAAPVDTAPANYADLWRSGEAALYDGIFKIDVRMGSSRLVALPGGTEGGEESAVYKLVVSPDDSYLLFIRKGDRSLWGVRLGSAR